ncbi:MAG TPA: hypothetical protein VFF00_09945 [Candidatus Elarobacter sp.]|nr:hypothetical protein [Dongiaceae bacterium]HZW54348.1 hypothetical protein [Candidatus Elarobacter sp.]
MSGLGDFFGGIGELLGGLGELGGERAVEGVVENVVGGDGEGYDETTTLDRQLTGRRRVLNVNDI